jgi:phosphoglycerate dehydrogenase-like enzyme
VCPSTRSTQGDLRRAQRDHLVRKTGNNAVAPSVVWAKLSALASADFITIHCPKTPETTGLFNAARLAHMKRTAFIVNTARGGIIDEKALYEVLKANRIAGAALDVFDQEPTPQENPLLTLPNEVLD